MKTKQVAVSDFTSSFCDPKTCYSTIGGVIAYFDRSHMTTTFARTLAPYLEPEVLKMARG